MLHVTNGDFLEELSSFKVLFSFRSFSSNRGGALASVAIIFVLARSCMRPKEIFERRFLETRNVHPGGVFDGRRTGPQPVSTLPVLIIT